MNWLRRLSKWWRSLYWPQWERMMTNEAEITPPVSEQGALREAVEALEFYANPQVYKPHPHGLAFDDRDLSFKAKAALARLRPLLDGSRQEPIGKRPVAFRVKDYADGWILFHDGDEANEQAERTGALMQGLYVRDGSRQEPTPVIPDGWVLVPKEPTVEMLACFTGYKPAGLEQVPTLYLKLIAQWQRMLAAAPRPTADESEHRGGMPFGGQSL